MKIFGFWHIHVKNNWEQIVEEQKKVLTRSDLAFKSEKIFVGTTSDISEILNCFDNHEIKCKDNFFLGELPIINYLHNFCINNECLVWYIHTKGVTRPNNEFVSAWRKFLEYWTINKWKLCVESLRDHDIVGALWNKNHFHGNFWWANSSYVSKCKPINFNAFDFQPTIRHQAEFFIGTARPKVKNLYEKKINMYKEKHSPNRFMKIF